LQQRNRSLEEKLQVSNDQIEEQKTTMTFLRHTLRQQETRDNSVIEQQRGESLKHQEELKQIQAKYSKVVQERKRIQRDLSHKMQRTSVLESVVTQMTVENLKLNGRLAVMDHKLEETSAEIERQSKQIEGLRAENQELLDKNHSIGIQPDEEMKELLDQCIQCQITMDVDDEDKEEKENDAECQSMKSGETQTEEKCIQSTYDEDTNQWDDDEEGEDLLNISTFYEDHDEYLNDTDSNEEDHDELDELNEDDDNAESEEKDKESKIINRDDLIAELLKEGLQRELEKKKKSGTKKKGFWEFITSRIDSAMYWR